MQWFLISGNYVLILLIIFSWSVIIPNLCYLNVNLENAET